VAFWSTERVLERAAEEGLVVPFSADRIVCGAYELALGPESFITSDSGVKRRVESGEQLVIPPGQFALLLTEESVRIPTDAIAFISIKAGYKFGGLINVSGFHVDPGFRGRLKFSVYNAGSENTILQRGLPTFLLWFAELTARTADGYHGSHQDQESITPEDVTRLQGEVASPSSLSAEIKDLKEELKRYEHRFNSGVWLVGILLVVLIGLVTASLTANSSGTVKWEHDSSPGEVVLPASATETAPDSVR